MVRRRATPAWASSSPRHKPLVVGWGWLEFYTVLQPAFEPATNHQQKDQSNMKTIKGFLCAAILVLAVITAQAQIGSPAVIVTSGSTSGAYAAITNNTTAYPTNAIVDCSGKKDVCFQFVSALSDAGTTANTVTTQMSVDKQNWVTHVLWGVTPAGTDSKVVVTNFAVGALPYLRVYSINNANANTGYITNYTIRVFTK